MKRKVLYTRVRARVHTHTHTQTIFAVGGKLHGIIFGAPTRVFMQYISTVRGLPAVKRGTQAHCRIRGWWSYGD